MSAIFISYRREDSAWATGAIHERLTAHFGVESIFTDIDSIPLGVDFRAYIDEKVGKCDVFLAVIGEDWLTADNEDGVPRLQQPDDFVRLEIESALSRGIPVIPVLVGKVSMPTPEQLPDSMTELAFRNGTPIRPKPSFDPDVERLVRGIEKHYVRTDDEQDNLSDRDTNAASTETKTEHTVLATAQSGDQTPLVNVAPDALADRFARESAQRRSSLEKGHRFDVRSLRIYLTWFVGIFVICGAAYRYTTSQPESGSVNQEGGKLLHNAPKSKKSTLQEDQIVNAPLLEPLIPEMVRIDGSSFQMGSPESERDRKDDERRHVATVKDFAIGKYEVTFAEYDRFCDVTGRDKPNDEAWGRGTRPVINVTWEDAAAYAQWLSDATGKRYRLPTEVEWEYAARAASDTAYWWGAEAGENRAHCSRCNSQWDDTQTAPVGSFAASPWGLHDTAGNVWEWTCSTYVEDYDGAEGRCATATDDRPRALRSGSWGETADASRSSARTFGDLGRYKNVGFRLVEDFGLAQDL